MSSTVSWTSSGQLQKQHRGRARCGTVGEFFFPCLHLSFSPVKVNESWEAGVQGIKSKAHKAHFARAHLARLPTAIRGGAQQSGVGSLSGEVSSGGDGKRRLEQAPMRERREPKKRFLEKNSQ